MTNRQKDRNINRQNDKQTEGQTDKRTERQRDRKTWKLCQPQNIIWIKNLV